MMIYFSYSMNGTRFSAGRVERSVPGLTIVSGSRRMIFGGPVRKVVRKKTVRLNNSK